MYNIKPYKKEFTYSYTLGAFPTFELIQTKPDVVKEVYVHHTFTEREKLEYLCKINNISLIENDKAIYRLSDKSNVFVIGVFEKYYCHLSESSSHIVLVNPSDMGNLGTILRTALAFGIKDIAFISPGADVFHPKVVRSSMGALFKVRQQYFVSFKDYMDKYPKHKVFTFMLNGENQLTVQNCMKPDLFSLVYGNEATGLDSSFLSVGTSLLIPQSPEVDSLNLTIAVGIGVYLFTRR